MSILATVAIEQLIQYGVKHFCICPGSRSTPLTLAVARHPKAHSHIFHDERSAAFAALGFGKAGQVAVLITTSGTAVANALPAVVEANLANIPLLLMTADRPPELRFTNANQTIDQIKLFGEQTRFFFDIPCESSSYSIEALQNTLSFAVSKCTGANAGPIHLNWMFREPFDLTQRTISIRSFPVPTEGILVPTSVQKKHIKQQLASSKRGLLVIGEITDPIEITAIKSSLSKVKWPCIIDASSGLSLLSHDGKVLAYEDLLRSPPPEFKPDIIVHLGNGLCTKRYEQWLQQLDCPALLFHPRPILSNPAARPFERYTVHLQSLDFLFDSLQESALLDWVQNHNQQLQMALPHREQWDEISVLQQSIDSVPKEGQLFIGNSMPIRDLNNYICSKYIPVASNRGASGIDGIPSTAFGWMLGNQKPTLLVLGDLSLMHDFGVLFTLQQQSFLCPLVIVVINNCGGGIFEMLPIATEETIFDSHFATIHQHQLAPITTAMNIDTHSVTDIPSLQTALQSCWENNGLQIIEARVERRHTNSIRKKLRLLTQGGSV